MSTALKRARNWKPVFLARLAQFGVMTDACKAADVGRTTVHRHRREDAKFNAECIEAVHTANDMFEMELVKRAIAGSKKTRTETVIFTDGRKKITTVEENAKSDYLLLAHMKSVKPERYRENYDLAKVVAAINANSDGNGSAGVRPGGTGQASGRKRSDRGGRGE